MKNILNFLLVLVFVMISACTKKRDAELPYGADRDLYKISDYEGQEFNLETDQIEKFAESEKSFESNKNFGFVKFKAQDPLKLVENTPMIGKLKTKYKLQYQFESGTLKVNKLADLKDLSLDEIPSATQLSDGRWAVPVVAYDASYFRLEAKRNDFNEKTSKLDLVPLPSRSGATHFKIDLNRKKKAEFLSKTLTLPMNFFAATKENPKNVTTDSKDWFLGVTILSTNIFAEKSFEIGGIYSFDQNLMPANRTRLIMSEKGLSFVNVMIDDRIEKNIDAKAEQRSTALFIPAEYKDFQMNENGASTGVREEASQNKNWQQRKFVQLKVEDLVYAGRNQNFKVSEILSFEKELGYLSFELLDQSQGLRIRVALYNVQKYREDQKEKYQAQPYIEKKYFPEDQKTFGFFAAGKSVVFDQNFSQKEDIAKIQRVVRFNPQRTFIEYRLNKEAPEWTESLFQQAMESWNKSLNEAGIQFKIKYSDENGKILRGQVGDLRYNTVNMIGDIEASQIDYGGLGPSISDSTGEIVMATATINLKGLLDFSHQNIKNYLLGQKQHRKMQIFMSALLPSFEVSFAKSDKAAAAYLLRSEGAEDLHLLQKIRFFDIKSSQIAAPLLVKNEGPKKQLMNFASFSHRQERFGSEQSLDVPKLMASCPEVIQLGVSIELGTEVDLNAEIPVKLIKECTQKLTGPRVVSVLLHELGHNLGLRHNFYGSADVLNYRTRSEDSNLPKSNEFQTSSVMDYPSFENNLVSEPGLYDLAALRWGYTETVETSEGTRLKVDISKPLTSLKSATLRSFKYCTDEDFYINHNDPFCAQFDSGYDPVKAVAELAKGFEESIQNYSYSNDRLKYKDPVQLAIFRYKRFLVPIAKYYEMWRLLLAKETGFDKKYLETISDMENYNRLISQVTDKKKYGEAQAQWNQKFYQASRDAFTFLLKLALTPDLSCAVIKKSETSPDGSPAAPRIELYSFQKIQRVLFERSGKTYLSCRETAVSDYLKTTYNAEVFDQVGYSFAPLYADLSQSRGESLSGSSEVIPEFSGVANDRLAALFILSGREAHFVSSQKTQFTPNFTDELPLREKMAKAFIDRISLGIDLNALKLHLPSGVKLSSNQFAPLFAAEREILKLLVSTLKNALWIPGKDNLNVARIEPYRVLPRYQLIDESLSTLTCTESPFGGSYCAPKKYKEAVKLINLVEEVNNLRKQWTPSSEVIQLFRAFFEKNFPKKGQGSELSYLHLYSLGRMIEDIPADKLVLKEEARKLWGLLFKAEDAIFGLFNGKSFQEIDQKEKEKSFAETEQIKLPIRSKPMKFWFDLLDPAVIDNLREFKFYKNLNSTKDYRGLDSEMALGRLDEIIRENQQLKQSYEINSEEWDAKGDILIQALFAN